MFLVTVSSKEGWGELPLSQIEIGNKKKMCQKKVEMINSGKIAEKANNVLQRCIY